SFHSSSFAVRVDLDRSPPLRSSPPKTKTPHSESACASPEKAALLMGGPSLSRRSDSYFKYFKLRANSEWPILSMPFNRLSQCTKDGQRALLLPSWAYGCKLC